MVSKIKIRENVLLRDYTTFRVGGPARFFCEVGSEAELAEAVAWARLQSQSPETPIFILGGGSNILVSDEGFAGLVILMNIKGVIFDESNGKVSRVTVGAGENWDGFVSQCVERGFMGLENLSGIPGTVGAAPVQNIGAYGAEVSHHVHSVRVFDMKVDAQENSWKTFSNDDCGFAYRDSVFKREKNRYVITSVSFSLPKFVSPEATPLNTSYKDIAQWRERGNDFKNPADVREAVLEIRARKLPDVRVVGTAGSFFKNPIISIALFADLKKRFPELPSFPVENSSLVKIPLAWVLDHVCGYKGVTKGNVGTYKNQALVIVNNVTATATAITTTTDIKKFADEISAVVKEKTGIDIEPEVQYVGI